jgi:hypothetical protein
MTKEQINLIKSLQAENDRIYNIYERSRAAWFRAAQGCDHKHPNGRSAAKHDKYDREYMFCSICAQDWWAEDYD